MTDRQGETTSTDEPIREITFRDRMIVAGVASDLIDSNRDAHAILILDAVRCCGEFPECSHVVDEVERMDAAE